jgi:hypothetical protein
MDTEFLALEDAAALENVGYEALRKRLRRQKKALTRDREDRRRKFVRLADLSQGAREKWDSQRVDSLAAQATHAEDNRLSAPLQRILSLAPDPPESAFLCIPEKHLDLVKRRVTVVDQLIFRRWEKSQKDLFGGQAFNSEREFIQALAAQKGKGFLPSAIYAMKAKAVAILRNAAIPEAERWQEIARCLTPKPRPGRSGFSYFSGSRTGLLENLTSIYRRQAGRSVRRTYEIFRERFPQEDGGPTFRQCRTALGKLPLTHTLRGHEAVKLAAGYIDRHYDDELAGDAWCIDEWELDGCFYDEEDHARLINYGEGRPIAHILSVIDERTTFIMGWILTWKVSLEEATLTLAERLLREFWTPLRLVADRAGRFRRLSHGRVTQGCDGELIELLTGPLGDLAVKPRLTKESNPRGNRIERSAHREYARRATEFGPSWRGANLTQRKTTDIDERVKRHLREHCKYGTCGPQLISIQQAEQIISKWINDLNTNKTRTKGCNGLTRLAAFNYFRPGAEEIARRKPSDALVDLAFVEREQRTIQAGGVIELSDRKRYSDVQLSDWTGERVEVLRYRRDPTILEVYPPGQEAPLIAHLRRAIGVNEPAALSEEIARLEHGRKIIAREEETLQIDRTEDNSAPRPEQEISGAEWTMAKLRKHSKGQFTSEIVRKALEMEAET